jgi:hypothetical protein
MRVVGGLAGVSAGIRRIRSSAPIAAAGARTRSNVAKPPVRIRATARLKAIVDCSGVNEIGYGRLSARVRAR